MKREGVAEGVILCNASILHLEDKINCIILTADWKMNDTIYFFFHKFF